MSRRRQKLRKKKMGETKIKIEGEKEKYLATVKKSKKWLLISITGALLVAVSLLGYFIFGRQGKDNSNGSIVNNKEDQVRRVIDGVYDVRENRQLYPVAVMIENLVTVRPQAGLENANLVYEALAEGGITRFMAVYNLTSSIAKIGPVRSARPYFLDWVKEYNALYGHVGGSPLAMSLISTYDVFNLDQFYDSRYFWRDKKIAAPHNVFTSSDLLIFALRDKKAPAEGNYEGYQFKEEAALGSRPTEQRNIAIDYSSFSYKVEYTYDREKNVYLRAQGGEPFVNQKNEQMAAKNVVVQYVKTSVIEEGRLSMVTIGEGQAVIFQDGKATAATWKKEGRNQRTLFYDETGKEIEFNAGQTWIQVVPDDRTVTYN
ncbi:MAG: DUF3048 domain-containing protein [Patescibacteria group bacterium]